MKKTRFTESQIMGVLRQMEGGVPAADLCREHGMSSATLYKWRAKYGGMDASCLVPVCGGLLIYDHQKDELWDKFFTGAPRPRTQSELSYSDRKLRTRR